MATNALELGVDIGVLDAVIMLGFPFSIANLVRYLFQSHDPPLHDYSVNNRAELEEGQGMRLQFWSPTTMR